MIPPTKTAAERLSKTLRAREDDDSDRITTLTTPFVAPTSCTGAFHNTTTITRTPSNGGTTWTEWELQYSSTDGCQPSGGSGVYTGLNFSPAVCPSGWTAYDLKASTTYGMKAKSVNYIASCCTSGFTINTDGVPNARVPLCHSQISSRTSYSDSHDIITTAASVHEPWFVTWRAGDASSLSPAPPSLLSTCTNTQLPSWVPGSAAETPIGGVPCREAYKSESEGGWGMSDSLLWFLIAGLPTIVGVAIAACICVCVFRAGRRKGRRLERETWLQKGYVMENTVGQNVSREAENNDDPATREAYGASASDDASERTRTEPAGQQPPVYEATRAANV